MKNINMFIKNESLEISECIINKPFINDVNCILATTNDSELTDQEIYVLPPNASVALFINRLFEVEATLFVLGEPNLNLSDYKAIKGNLIFSTLTFYKCVNLLNNIIKTRNEWKNKLKISNLTQDTLEIFCKESSALLVSPVAILSPDFRIKSFATPSGTIHLFDKRIKEDGDIICALKCLLEHDTTFTSNHLPYRVSLEMTTVIILPILYQCQIVDYMLFFTSSNEHFEKILAFHHLFSETLFSYYTNDKEADPHKKNILIHYILKDLIELNIKNNYVLEERLNKIPLKLKEFCQCLVIKFENETVVSSVCDSMLERIRGLIPNVLCTIFQDHIVVWLQHDNGLSTNCHDLSFEALLKEYHALAAFSCISNHYLHFNTLYLQCINTLRYNKHLKGKVHFRVLSYEQFRVIDIVEMCSEHFKSKSQQENLIFLCDPKSIAILTYDRQHDTDLFNVMYTYLANNCNTSKTAIDLYMHRNTMICRLNKIEEIIGVKLSDEQIKFNLIFSYFIIQYITNFLEYDPLDMVHAASIEPAHIRR